MILALLPWMGVSPAAAEETVSPGESIEFLAADSCDTDFEIPNSVKELARAHASCNASQRVLKAEVRPITGPQWVGLRTVRASATLTNDFEVLADPDTVGNTVGAWVMYDSRWNGMMLFVGFFSPPSVELSIRLRDVTDAKVIKGEMIWGRDGSGAGISIPYIPIDLNLGGGVDNQSVSNTFAAVLTRGHKYRIEMTLTCAVFSDGGFDVGSECDYMDGFLVGSDGSAGWTRLAVKVGLDEEEVLRKLEALLRHTHTYLTGKGVGHNNTEAATSEPVEDPDSTPGTTRPGRRGGKKGN
jgi:hypothetical protein